MARETSSLHHHVYITRVTREHHPYIITSTSLVWHGKHHPYIITSTSLVWHGKRHPYIITSTSLVWHGKHHPYIITSTLLVWHGKHHPKVVTSTSLVWYWKHHPKVVTSTSLMCCYATSETVIFGRSHPSEKSNSDTFFVGPYINFDQKYEPVRCRPQCWDTPLIMPTLSEVHDNVLIFSYVTRIPRHTSNEFPIVSHEELYPHSSGLAHFVFLII